jgi:hypothetical protein
MNDQINLLLLAYYFPPDSSSGSLRPLFLANHLQAMGTKVTVLTAAEENYLRSQPVDLELLSRVRKDIEIVRAKVRRPREFTLSLRDKLFRKRKSVDETAHDLMGSSVSHLQERTSFVQKCKDTITDLLACPDPHVGWIPDTVRRGIKLISEKKINVIMATGSPWSCMLSGVLLRKKTGIPLILDFRDPWVSNPGFMQRGKIARNIETKMERYVVSMTDKIVANTDELRENFLQRFRFLMTYDVHTIPNGFEDFISSLPSDNRRFTIVHAGSLYFSRTPAPLLEALYVLIAKKKIPPDLIRLKFVGGIDYSDERINKLLSMEHLKQVVQIIPRLPYDEAIKLQLEADALLLVQPGFPLQVPRKLYEYMSINRTVLALTDEDGATARIVKTCRLGSVVKNRVEAIKPALFEMYMDWRNNCSQNSSMDEIARYRNHALASCLHNLLREMIHR